MTTGNQGNAWFSAAEVGQPLLVDGNNFQALSIRGNDTAEQTAPTVNLNITLDSNSAIQIQTARTGSGAITWRITPIGWIDHRKNN